MKDLLSWFDRCRRDLPWRRNRTPYTAWIAEIMLQQTRVDTVIAYYERWLERFPDVETLAAAEEQEVLRLWEGLGYYSRARSLHKAARQVVQDYGGVLPREVSLLRKLPGIGDYTAGAIASIAYGEPAPALDGNIRRILTRYDDYDTPIHTTPAEKYLWQRAEELLDRERPGDHNEALMDLGATICLPGEPHCAECPLAAECKAHRHGTAALRPVQKKAAPIPHYIVTAAVLYDPESKRFLLTRRRASGLLGGLWEFPGGKQEEGETLEDCLQREIREELAVEIAIERPFGVYRHAYTHFKVTLHAFCCHLTAGTPQALAADALDMFTLSELPDLPMGKIDRMIARNLASDTQYSKTGT